MFTVSNIRSPRRVAAVAATAMALLSPVAFGHAGHAPVESTFAVLSHFVGGLDHLLFFVAVGVFASRRNFSSLLKLSALSAGLVIAAVHMASGLAMVAGAVASASVIMLAGYGLGRSFDLISRRARS